VGSVFRETHWVGSDVNLRRVIKHTRRECFEPNTGVGDMRGILTHFGLRSGKVFCEFEMISCVSGSIPLNSSRC
jgi:hypothetical protein